MAVAGLIAGGSDVSLSGSAGTPLVSSASGNTLLHHAAAAGSEQAIAMLLAGVVDPTVTNAAGETPRQLAPGGRAGDGIRMAIDKALLLVEPTAPFDEVKLFLCGFQGVGKTTLARALPRGHDLSLRWPRRRVAVQLLGNG